MQQQTTSCDVEVIYEGITPDDSRTKVITSYGNIEDVEKILVPIDLKEGVYELTVSKKANNLYKVNNKEIYIQTRFCFELGIYLDAILKVENNYTYTSSKLIFTD
ncbi:MAG: hypothetical protein J7L73_07230 [Anaerolineales bacterium]|nr:hypothetical protein [Anaerolineales bacterium]